MRHCKIHRAIPDDVVLLGKLRKLWLGFNQISSLPEDITTLPLTELDLEANSAMAALPTTLGRLSYLKTLNIRDMKLKTHLPTSLANCLTLKNLMLSGNK